MCIRSFLFRVREVELVLARSKTSCREKDEKIDSLQKRYCLSTHVDLHEKLRDKKDKNRYGQKYTIVFRFLNHSFERFFALHFDFM